MTIKRSDLVFVGLDGWYRYVFQHQPTGHYYCTTDQLGGHGDGVIEGEIMLNEAESLYIKSPAKDFEGEPSHSVALEN